MTLILPLEQILDPVLEPHARFSRRVGLLTLGFGVAASIAAAALASWRAGAGFAVGAVLGWLNFRWLDRERRCRVRGARATGLAAAASPKTVYYAFAGRYALIGLVAYGTVRLLHVPVLAILGGLLLLGAAAVAESLYEVFTGSI